MAATGRAAGAVEDSNAPLTAADAAAAAGGARGLRLARRSAADMGGAGGWVSGVSGCGAAGAMATETRGAAAGRAARGSGADDWSAILLPTAIQVGQARARVQMSHAAVPVIAADGWTRMLAPAAQMSEAEAANGAGSERTVRFDLAEWSASSRWSEQRDQQQVTVRDKELTGEGVAIEMQRDGTGGLERGEEMGAGRAIQTERTKVSWDQRPSRAASIHQHQHLKQITLNRMVKLRCWHCGWIGRYRKGRFVLRIARRSELCVVCKADVERMLQACLTARAR